MTRINVNLNFKTKTITGVPNFPLQCENAVVGGGGGKVTSASEVLLCKPEVNPQTHVKNAPACLHRTGGMRRQVEPQILL